jgi:hypothetical protein
LALIEPLVRERPDDPLASIARVRLLAGQLQALKDGGWYPKAIAAFERAASLGDELLGGEGRTENLPEILARTHLNAAFVFRNTGRTDDALRAALRGHALAERATGEHPGDFSAARTLLWASTQATILLRTKGLTDEAQRICEQGIAFGKALVR